jgi:hypothetical protein
LILAQALCLSAAGDNPATPERIYPAPPSDMLAPAQFFRFSGLASGARWDGGSGKYFYRDFAIIMFYAGPGVVHIDVRVSDDVGLDHRYIEDNLGRPLVIDGSSGKRTCMLNVAGAAFPLNDAEFEYHPNITLEVAASEPIYTLPPGQFSTIGHGRTVREAEEEGWQHFGFAVPEIVRKNLRCYMYSIFWRNLSAFPDGWDTKITLVNPADRGISARLRYLPDYNRNYDPISLQHADSPAPDARDIYLPAGQAVTLYLRDLLGATLESSAYSEGCLFVELVRFDPFNGRWDGEELQMSVEVLPLSGGRRACNETSTQNREERPKRPSCAPGRTRRSCIAGMGQPGLD